MMISMPITTLISNFCSYIIRGNLKGALTFAFLAVLCLSVFSAFALRVSAQQSSAGWPMFRANSSHNGARAGHPTLTPALLWNYNLGEEFYSSPAIVNSVV